MPFCDDLRIWKGKTPDLVVFYNVPIIYWAACYCEHPGTIVREVPLPITHQALLVEIWWNSRDSTPSYDELALVIPFA